MNVAYCSFKDKRGGGRGEEEMILMERDEAEKTGRKSLCEEREGGFHG